MAIYFLEKIERFRPGARWSFFSLAGILLVLTSLLFSLEACRPEHPPVFRLWDELKLHTPRIISEENWRAVYQDFINKEKNDSEHRNVVKEGWATFYLKGKTFEAVLAPPNSVSSFELNLVKKYVFEPSGRIVWIVVGRERDYQVLPEVNYCTCEDYYFRVLDGEILLCYHLLAQKLAEALGKYEEIKESDSLYETLTAEWRFIKKEWYTEET